MDKNRPNNEDIISKVDVLTEALKSHVDNFESYVREDVAFKERDIAWKKKVEPILGSITELSSVGEGVKAWKYLGGSAGSFSKVILSVGAIIGAIIVTIKFLMK